MTADTKRSERCVTRDLIRSPARLYRSADECLANDHEPDHRIALVESDRALVRNAADVTHSPTVPARSIALTRKRTVALVGMVRLA